MNPTLEAVAENNPDAAPPDIAHAYNYLSHYGYFSGAILSGSVKPAMAVDALGTAVKEFQRVAGLVPTGEIDQPTLDMMSRPRCGCLDVQRMVAPEEARWRKNRLGYFTRRRVSGLPPGDVDDIVFTAFKQWRDTPADIEATPVLDEAHADIIIDIGQGRQDGFDGPSGTLAWAYLPTGNDQQLLMRFDADEQWVKSGNGIWLLNVACHEFGHLYGLDHSRVSSALMAPFYNQQITKPQKNDDISRIQALYGVPANSPPPVSPPKKQLTVTFEFDSLIGVSIPGYKVVPA